MDPAYSSVPVPASGPQRPVGVVLAAVALGLITLFWFFGGLISIFGGLFVRTPQAAENPLAGAVQIVMGIFILLLCGLCAWVVVGLFRLKNWARVGILVVGAVIAFYSLVMAAIFCVMAFINLDSMVPAGTSSVSPVAMKAVFFGMAGMSFLFVLVGVWWLVYFNRRRVRALFVMNAAGLSVEPGTQAPAFPAETAMVPAAQSRSVIEILVICLGVLYLVAAVSGIIFAPMQFPLFLLGHVFRGTAASALYLLFAAISLWLGVGLLRHIKAALMTAIAFNALGLVQAAMLFLPGNRARMADYQLEIAHRMISLPTAQMPNQALLMQGPIYFLSGVVGVIGVLAVCWLLLRAMPLFEPKAS